jgi:hypothetical protein
MAVVESTLSLMSSGSPLPMGSIGGGARTTGSTISPSAPSAVSRPQYFSTASAPSRPTVQYSTPLQYSPIQVAPLVTPYVKQMYSHPPLEPFVVPDSHGHYTYFQLFMTAIAAILLAVAIFYIARWIYGELIEHNPQPDDVDYCADDTVDNFNIDTSSTFI